MAQTARPGGTANLGWPDAPEEPQQEKLARQTRARPGDHDERRPRLTRPHHVHEVEREEAAQHVPGEVARLQEQERIKGIIKELKSKNVYYGDERQTAYNQALYDLEEKIYKSV